MAQDNARVLIVDDEEDILEFLSYNLSQDGYEVKTASDGVLALSMLSDFMPDLVVLDIMMPEMDGVEVCKRIRKEERYDKILIAFLTARNEDYTQIAALDVGGDDFIRKPIRPNVFKSRVRALLRRVQKETRNDAVIELGDIILDREQYTVSIQGEPVDLARKEFQLLDLLASKPGKVFKRSEILAKVWGSDVIVGSRTIDVHIRKLREKVGRSLIKTVKGVGYKVEF